MFSGPWILHKSELFSHWQTISKHANHFLFSRIYAPVNKTIPFSSLSKQTNKKTNTVVELVAYRWQVRVQTAAAQDGAYLCLQLSFCCCYFTCQYAVQVGLDLQVWNCCLCSSVVRWCWLVSGPLHLSHCASFSFLIPSVTVILFFPNLTSSDPHGWKVQRPALQTDCHWTDKTRWAVICLKSDSALVMFWPIRATRLALSQTSAQWRMDTDMSVH